MNKYLVGPFNLQIVLPMKYTKWNVQWITMTTVSTILCSTLDLNICPLLSLARYGLWDRHPEDHPDGSLPALGNGTDRGTVQVCVLRRPPLHRDREETRGSWTGLYRFLLYILKALQFYSVEHLTRFTRVRGWSPTGAIKLSLWGCYTMDSSSIF